MRYRSLKGIWGSSVYFIAYFIVLWQDIQQLKRNTGKKTEQRNNPKV